VPPRTIDLGNPVADHPLNRGLVAWYYGLPNNSGGTRWHNLTKARYEQTLSGPTWRDHLTLGGGLQLAGSPDFASGAPPVTVEPLTIACWFKPAAIPATSYLVALATGAGADASTWALTSLSTPAVGASARNSAGTSRSAASTAGPVVNTWSHGCGVWATASDRAAYFNGANKGVGVVAAIVVSAPTILATGTDTDGTGAHATYFTGAIADVSIWNRALSDDEVAAVYLEGRAGNPTRLRRYTPSVWSFGGTAAGRVFRNSPLDGLRAGGSFNPSLSGV
jgi:hypothetical protein